MTFLGFALSAWRAKPGRALGGILVVAGSACLVTVLFATRLKLHDVVAESNIPRLIVAPATSVAGGLPLSYAKRISAVAQTDQVFYWGLTAARAPNGQSFGVRGDVPGFAGAFPTNYVSATPEALQAWAAHRGNALASRTLIESMGWHVGSDLTVETTDGPLRVRLVGETVGVGGERLTVHYETLNELYPPARKNTVMGFTVYSPLEQRSELAAKLVAEFANDSAPVNAVTPEAALSGNATVIGPVVDLLGDLARLIVILTAVITANIIGYGLKERRSEIAALRCMGFSRMRVFRLLFLETLANSVAGGLIGSGIPFLFFHNGGLKLGPAFLGNIKVGPTSLAVGFVAVLLLGLVATIPPVVVALRRSIVSELNT